MKDLTRRGFVGAAGLGGLGLTAPNALRGAVEAQASVGEVAFTLAPNLELMFDKAVPYEERIALLGKEGAKAYSFWNHRKRDIPKLRRVADRYGMSCASLSGSSQTGWKTGLTVEGYQQDFLDDFGSSVEAASQLGARNLVTFVGKRQADVPWSKQFSLVVEGLKKAGDIAAKEDVYLTLEPLSKVFSADMFVMSALEGYELIRAVDHPHVKLDFDVYHLQLAEGNLTNNLRLGLEEDLIAYVEIGDVPSRAEPGTGEVNFNHLFRVLVEMNYAGYVGMEHKANSGYKSALRSVRDMVDSSSSLRL